MIPRWLCLGVVYFNFFQYIENQLLNFKICVYKRLQTTTNGINRLLYDSSLDRAASLWHQKMDLHNKKMCHE